MATATQASASRAVDLVQEFNAYLNSDSSDRRSGRRDRLWKVPKPPNLPYTRPPDLPDTRSPNQNYEKRHYKEETFEEHDGQWLYTGERDSKGRKLYPDLAKKPVAEDQLLWIIVHRHLDLCNAMGAKASDTIFKSLSQTYYKILQRDVRFVHGKLRAMRFLQNPGDLSTLLAELEAEGCVPIDVSRVGRSCANDNSASPPASAAGRNGKRRGRSTLDDASESANNKRRNILKPSSHTETKAILRERLELMLAFMRLRPRATDEAPSAAETSQEKGKGSGKSSTWDTTKHIHDAVKSILEKPARTSRVYECSMEQAKERLAERTPPRVMVVRNGHPPEETYIDVDSNEKLFAKWKRTKQKMIVIDSGQKNHSGVPVNTSEVVKKLQTRGPGSTMAGFMATHPESADPYQHALNLLQLPCPESRICPNCFEGRLKRRYDLLPEICRRLRALAAPLGDDKSSRQDFTGCDVFAIFGQEDAISMTHHDRHSSTTWVIVVTGRKLWIVWPKMSEEDWKAFKTVKTSWTGGKPEAIILNPGDILVMQPLTPHTVMTLQDSLCYGGMLWDYEKVPLIVKNIIWELDNKSDTTNEKSALELAPIIHELYKMTIEEGTEQEREDLFPGTQNDDFKALLKELMDRREIRLHRTAKSKTTRH